MSLVNHVDCREAAVQCGDRRWLKWRLCDPNGMHSRGWSDQLLKKTAQAKDGLVLRCSAVIESGNTQSTSQILRASTSRPCMGP
jgi:hypothetical protein